MRQVNTNNYLVIEVIGGLDAYCDDVLVCCLHGKTFAHFSYDGKIDKDKLEKAIEDEIELVDLVEKLREEM